MSLLSFLQRVYSLDTLDTRFTTQATASYRTVIDSRRDDEPKDAQRERVVARASPSKWKTPEFIFYAIFVSLCIPLMCYIPYTVSRRMQSIPGWKPCTMMLIRSLKLPILDTINLQAG